MEIRRSRSVGARHCKRRAQRNQQLLSDQGFGGNGLIIILVDDKRDAPN
jgi:hypothetical protein